MILSNIFSSQKIFQKEYKGSEESVRRGIWEKHVNQIIQHNLQYDLGFHTYRKGLNEYADYVSINQIIVQYFIKFNSYNSHVIFLSSGRYIRMLRSNLDIFSSCVAKCSNSAILFNLLLKKMKMHINLCSS